MRLVVSVAVLPLLILALLLLGPAASAATEEELANCTTTGECAQCDATSRVCNFTDGIKCLCPEGTDIDCNNVCGGDGTCESSSSSSSAAVSSSSSSLTSSSTPAVVSSSSSSSSLPAAPLQSSSESSSSSSNNKSSSGSEEGKLPWYGVWGSNAGVYGVLPLLIFGGVVLAVYLKFRALHEGGLPRWLATLFCCCGVRNGGSGGIGEVRMRERRRGGRRYEAVADDAEWLTDDIEAAPAMTPLSPRPVPVPAPATVAAAATAPAPAAAEAPTSPLAPPPKSQWDVQWDDEDGDTWDDFPQADSAKKPRSVGH